MLTSRLKPAHAQQRARFAIWIEVVSGVLSGVLLLAQLQLSAFAPPMPSNPAAYDQVGHSPGAVPQTEAHPLILSGQSVGPVKIGDARDVVLKYFPLKKDMDSEYSWTAQRSEVYWLDLSDKRVEGFVTFSIRGGRVFQIASATPRFRTEDGITLSSTPEDVRRHYHNLQAFVLLHSDGTDVGGRDLIYWVSESKGIAFQLSYFPNAGRRLVREIIVFAPHTEFLPKGSVEPPQAWKRLTPYSLNADKQTDPK